MQTKRFSTVMSTSISESCVVDMSLFYVILMGAGKEQRESLNLSMKERVRGGGGLAFLRRGLMNPNNFILNWKVLNYYFLVISNIKRTTC